MRGSKGGFWDRLLSRFRLRRLKKIREEKKIIQKNLDNLKNKEIKKNEEIYLNRVFSLKSKKRTVKLYKKGIASKIKTTPKINSNKAIKDNKKTINKVIKFNQKRIKKKVGITSKKIEKQVSVNQDTIKDKEINNNNVILEFKTEKLISELNKIVNNNREMINSITYQINELKSEIDEAKSIKKINEIENKLIEIKRKLDELVKNYSNIKNTNLKQLNNEKVVYRKNYKTGQFSFYIPNDADIDIDFDVIGYVDPGITINIIRDCKRVEKLTVSLPEKLINVIKCKNPRCITSTEQEINHIFKLTDKEKAEYRCLYCETKAQ